MTALKLPKFVSRLIADPPPALAFEISEAGIAVARTSRPAQMAFRPLEPDVISVSPVKDNILRLEALTAQVKAAASAGAPGKKRQQAAVILPDCSVRVSVLDFDSFPSDAAQQLSLVRFRVRKTLPFDVEGASLSYFAQPHNGNKKLDVVVAVAPLEIVARYEAPFRAAGLQTGVVTTSTLASLSLVRDAGLAVLVKLSGRMLTISVLKHGVLKLLRSIELAEISVAEVLGHLYPTFAYTEDQLSAKPDKIVLCGFGAETDAAAAQFERELAVPVDRLRSRYGTPDQVNAGLMGYLESIEEA